MRHLLPLVLLAGLASATADAQQTRLDSALVAANTDAALAARFYDAFLVTNLFVPTWQVEGELNTRRRAEEDEAFSPVVIETEDGPFIPVFDRLDRLQTWAAREIGYVAMPAHALVASLAGHDIGLVMNVGTDHFKLFGPEEITQLHQSVTAREERTVLPGGTHFLVGVPASIPDGLLAALRTELEQTDEVAEAYLLRLHVGGEASPGFAVMLVVDDEDMEHFEAIQHALGVASRGHVPDGKYLTVLPSEGGGVSLGDVAEAEPFYVRRR